MAKFSLAVMESKLKKCNIDILKHESPICLLKERGHNELMPDATSRLGSMSKRWLYKWS